MTARASISRRSGASAMAMLLSIVALAACSGNEQAMNDKLAAAEAAADKAVAAQKAAERAAATAVNSRPPAPAEPPQVVSDSANDADNDAGDSGEMAEHELPLPGGPGQTVTADGVIVPG